MNTRRLSSVAFASALGTLGVVLACCSGGTDNGNEDFSGGQFVGSDSATGSLTVNVITSDLSVSDTSGFGVSVKNALGQPVAGMKVSCDSEEGVAILEPTTGGEITDSGGNISGVIGCAAPGSYQFACRLPVGVNKRQLIDIKCRGPVPTGFTGFSGGAGGGLGGGNDGSGDGGTGGTDTSGVRITNLSFDDTGSNPDVTDSNFSIDITQDVCPGDSVDAGTPTPLPVFEPFFDTVLQVRVVNNTNQSIQFSKMNYVVGGTASATDIAFVGAADAVAGGGGVGVLKMLAFRASGGQKFVIGNNTAITAGFQTVDVTLTGENSLGDTIEVSGSVTLSFADFGRCP